MFTKVMQMKFQIKITNLDTVLCVGLHSSVFVIIEYTVDIMWGHIILSFIHEKTVDI